MCAGIPGVVRTLMLANRVQRGEKVFAPNRKNALQPISLGMKVQDDDILRFMRRCFPFAFADGVGAGLSEQRVSAKNPSRFHRAVRGNCGFKLHGPREPHPLGEHPVGRYNGGYHLAPALGRVLLSLGFSDRSSKRRETQGQECKPYPHTHTPL